MQIQAAGWKAAGAFLVGAAMMAVALGFARPIRAEEAEACSALDVTPCVKCKPDGCNLGPNEELRPYTPFTKSTCVDWDRDGLGHCLLTSGQNYWVVDSTTGAIKRSCQRLKCAEASGTGNECENPWSP